VVIFCLTEYKDERQQTITDCRQIWQIYLEKHSFFDLIIMLILILESSGLDQLVVVVPVLVRMVSVFLATQRIKEAARHIEDAVSLSTSAETTIEVCKLFFKIMTFLHILSIILNLFADLERRFG
jgi:ABC-type xylose transport system permease subunit